MSLTALALALFVVTPQPGAPVASIAEAPELAAAPLVAGRTDHALATLEKASAADPQDAGVLINLGIAYAQAGDEARARAAFEAAVACNETIELETADGEVTDSRILGRKALKMLARGEFRAAPVRAEQLTLRD